MGVNGRRWDFDGQRSVQSLETFWRLMRWWDFSAVELNFARHLCELKMEKDQKPTAVSSIRLAYLSVIVQLASFGERRRRQVSRSSASDTVSLLFLVLSDRSFPRTSRAATQPF